MTQEIQKDLEDQEIQHPLFDQALQVLLSLQVVHRVPVDQQNQQDRWDHFLLESQAFHVNQLDPSHLLDQAHPFHPLGLQNQMGQVDQEDLLLHHCQLYLQNLFLPYLLCHLLGLVFQLSLFLQAYLADQVVQHLQVFQLDLDFPLVHQVHDLQPYPFHLEVLKRLVLLFHRDYHALLLDQGVLQLQNLQELPHHLASQSLQEDLVDLVIPGIL